jgi:hypothetical protein
MRLYRTGKPERLSGSCVAASVPPGEPMARAKHVGYHGFRGSAGAKTAPAGYWHALSDLEGKLAGIEKTAQAKMAF